MTRWTLVALVLLAAGLAVYYFGFASAGGELRLPGIVEIQEVNLGSKTGRRVFNVMVQEGVHVSPGQELVIFEVPDLTATRDQLRAKVEAAEADYDKAMKGPRDEEKRAAKAAADAAKARYEKMLEGYRVEEKKQAASDLETAAADLKQSKEELERTIELYRAKATARADYDAALGARDRAQGRFNAAKAKLDMMLHGNRPQDKAEAKAAWEQAQAQSDQLQNGTRPEDKMAAKANLDEARAKLDEGEINLREGVVRVPDNLGKALVEVVAVRPGDLVPAGQPVVRVLRVGDMWVKIFVPETQLYMVTINKEVDVYIDGYRQVLKGKIKQKASSAEFTPRNVQSADERRYQVFGVKVFVNDPEGILNSGMAAEVRIPTK